MFPAVRETRKNRKIQEEIFGCETIKKESLLRGTKERENNNLIWLYVLNTLLISSWNIQETLQIFFIAN